ncbi:MAG: sodium/solute symporter [Thermoguttaceae bacterium]|jgi:SSS family solute:Na+ symporter
MSFHLTPLDITVFALYMLAVLAVGIWASRLAKRTKRDYFLAGDRLAWWMIGGSIVASNISSHHLVGAMGVAYSRGFVAMTIEWGAILIGLNALLWVFLPFYLRNGFYTMPEFLQRRFSGAARTVYAVLVLLTYLFVEISAVLCLGALAIYQLLGVPVMVSVVVLAVVTGVYTIAGGLRAVVWTEMLQLVVLLLGGIALSIATIQAVGGPAAVWEMSDQWHLLLPADDPDFPWTMYLGGVLCISVFYCAANQFIVQRALAAKNEWHARMGVVFTDYLKFLIPLVIIVPGMVAPKLFPNLERPDVVFPLLVERLLPSGLVGLVMAGLIAAVMSHISGAVNSCTTIATIDLYLPWKQRRVRRRASEKAIAGFDTETERTVQEAGRHAPALSGDDAQAVRFGRMFGVVTILFGIFWAEVLTGMTERPIFVYLYNAYGYFTPGIATMFLLGIFWKRTTHAGALAAGLLTIPLTLAFDLLLPEMPFLNRTGIVFWLCMGTCVVVSLMTRPKPAEAIAGLIWNRESLALPPELKAKMRGLRNPTLWWALITAAVLFFYMRFP